MKIIHKRFFILRQVYARFWTKMGCFYYKLSSFQVTGGLWSSGITIILYHRWPEEIDYPKAGVIYLLFCIVCFVFSDLLLK
jgi:hypothetical protein